MFENKNLLGTQYSLGPGRFRTLSLKNRSREWIVSLLLVKGVDSDGSEHHPTPTVHSGGPLGRRDSHGGVGGRAMNGGGRGTTRKGRVSPKRGLFCWGLRAAEKCRFLAHVSGFEIH